MRQANSNSAARAVGRSLGIPEADISKAIEGSRLFSPGFDRDLFQLYPGELRDIPVERHSLPPPGAQSRFDGEGGDAMRSRFAHKLLGPGDGAEDILIKDPRDWTEPEVRTLMGSELYRRPGDPFGAFANDQVRSWHERAFGTAEMKRRGAASIPPAAKAISARAFDGGGLEDGLTRIADGLAARARTPGETGAVQDWQSALNGMARRRSDGSSIFLPVLDVDGDFGPRTRFATKQALASFGLAPLLRLFG